MSTSIQAANATPASTMATAPVSRLIDFLPAIFHEQDEPNQPAFLPLYLRAFERILFGGADLKTLDNDQDAETTPADIIPDGLEEEIIAIPSLFDPCQTPEEFLPWLAGWAALSFHPDLSLERRRNLLAHIIPLYRIRGTRKYIESVLELCLDTFVSITDNDIPALQIGLHSTIGMDSYVGGGPPHFFTVNLIAPKITSHEKEVQAAIAHSVLSLAKPAHTFYDLTLDSPHLQVGVHSTIGLNTVLSPS